MKERTQGILIGVILATILIYTISYATQKIDYAQRVYRDIKITLNGLILEPKDVNGNDVEPFIIDGTTYLPVRAICEALDLNVNWDDDKNIVELVDEKTSVVYKDTNKILQQEQIVTNNQDTSVNTEYTLKDNPTEMQKKALKDANNMLKSNILGGTSETMLRNFLRNSGYLNSEIQYAMSNINVDWKEQAVKYTEKQINNYNRKSTLKTMLKVGLSFTEEEAEYAINHPKFDEHWKRCAAQYANTYNPDYEYTELDAGFREVRKYKKTFEEYMKEQGFNDEEITFAREELKYKQ